MLEKPLPVYGGEAVIHRNKVVSVTCQRQFHAYDQQVIVYTYLPIALAGERFSRSGLRPAEEQARPPRRRAVIRRMRVEGVNRDAHAKLHRHARLGLGIHEIVDAK